MKTLYIWLLVSLKILAGKISVEKLKTLLENDVLVPEVTVLESNEVIAACPDFVKSHLTPNFETGKSTGVKHPKLVLHDKQVAGEAIDGHKIYAWLIDTNQLSACVELADLQWWEQHPNEIPEEFKGKFIYAWASVVLDDYGFRFVPYLNCHVVEPFVDWFDLDVDWDDNGPACLRAS
ncbi:MAG: hypothetical protein PHT88_04940 [Candidatus Moranbacteria bacterium]|nr:hypothetical protein [Candidatus Moranbacteria bacterium]